MPHIQPSEIANTLLDMEFRLKDGMEHLVVKISRSNKTDFIKLKHDVYTVYEQLHAVLDPSDLMGKATTVDTLSKLFEIDGHKLEGLTSLSVAYLNSLEPEQAVKEIRMALATPQDLMGIPQDMGRIVSIQVQTTRLTGAGAEVVPFKDQHIKPTHWSLYKRDAAGMAHWIEDIQINQGGAGDHYTAVMIKAAKYSQMYSAFIEQVK